MKRISGTVCILLKLKIPSPAKIRYTGHTGGIPNYGGDGIFFIFQLLYYPRATMLKTSANSATVSQRPTTVTY